MTKIKELAKEMNMSLIDYFEKYRTVGVNTTPPAVVDASVTNVGSATTALVGSGTNSFDANNPLVRRAMEAVVL
jgi:hypothetical protein